MSRKDRNSSEMPGKPRVGIPWRTREEERAGNVEKLNFYFEAIRRAGGEPEHVSLELSNEELKNKTAGRQHPMKRGLLWLNLKIERSLSRRKSGRLTLNGPFIPTKGPAVIS